MLAKKITLTDFRNIEAAAVELSPGVNVLYGNNAEGKTNLLEAIYFASLGKSFRAAHAQEVIRFGAETAALSLDFEGAARAQNITMRIFKNRARAVEKNRVRITRMSELVGSFRAVLFCPEHLSLIKAGPAERRQFLDIAISALEPPYLAALQRYAQILKQRNALIRGAKDDPALFESTVDIWSRQLAHEGAYIARSRMRYVKKASVLVENCFLEMTDEREQPRLTYCGPCKGEEHDYEDVAATEQECYRQLSTAHEREIGAGATLYGVHKDDMDVLLNGRSARLYASQGQQRSLSLALKLAEGEICRDDCGEYPVFLFDDVLSELDAGRRAYLLHRMGGKQVILTTCEKGKETADRCILVENGRYTPTT